MKHLSFQEFDEIYQTSVRGIWKHWNEEMQREIARHCRAWAPGRSDFLSYLRLSSIRFYKAYSALAASGGRSVCDVGGFWGVWPVTAKKLGFEVTMTEALKFYGESFGPLFSEIAASGVNVVDQDPFSPDAEAFAKFDLVTVMAVLEHYPHSLKTLMQNVKGLLAENGRIYLEAPNIAYWPHRAALLRGHTPLAELEDIYLSEEPFIGHHHEFTLAEMRDLARLSGLRILSEDLYNYSIAGRDKLKFAVRHPFLTAAMLMSKNGRECIAVACEIEKV